MKLDGVEIKVTVAGGQVPEAVERLDLGDASRLTIWFYDRTTPRRRLSLFAAGVVIRVRSDDDGRDGDSTVKLRPCPPGRLTGRWLVGFEEDGLKYRLEEDWAGDRHVLAASLQADLTRQQLAQVTDRTTLPADLLTGAHGELLADCGPDVPVTPSELTRLGPIDATRWKKVREPGFGALDARAERWVVGGLDFLEVSIKVQEGEAEAAGQQLWDAMAGTRLSLDPSQEAKTSRVLELLAG